MFTSAKGIWENSFACFVLCLLVTFSLTSQVQAKQYGIYFVDYSYDGCTSARAEQEMERLASTKIEWTNVLAATTTMDSVYRVEN